MLVKCATFLYNTLLPGTLIKWTTQQWVHVPMEYFYCSLLTPSKDLQFCKIVPMSVASSSLEPNVYIICLKFLKLQIEHGFSNAKNARRAVWFSVLCIQWISSSLLPSSRVRRNEAFQWQEGDPVIIFVPSKVQPIEMAPNKLLSKLAFFKFGMVGIWKG